MKLFTQNKESTRISFLRLHILCGVIILLMTLILVRLFNLQILEHQNYLNLASGQYEVFKNLFAQRGRIYISQEPFFSMTDVNLNQSGDDLYPLASNKIMYDLYAEPAKVEDAKTVVNKLAEIIDVGDEAQKDILVSKLEKKDDPYELIQKKVDKKSIEKLQEAPLTGIGYKEQTVRYYPDNNLASHILGFVRETETEHEGQYGLEGFFNKELSGENGYLESERDPWGRWISITSKNFKQAINGDDLILTLDKNIQYIACEALKEGLKTYKAEQGSVLIMEPKTGAILAMCNFPDFNPNAYNLVENIEVFNNQAIYGAYEPGSIFKPFTLSAGLDAGVISPETTYEDTGAVPYNDRGDLDYVNPKYQLRNYDKNAHGINTMTQVLERSLNTGTIFVMQRLGVENFEKYVKIFGFGKKTGIELETENPGDISSLAKRKELFAATASFGQGITVTPLQIATAYCALANGGKLVKPYLVKEIIKPDGTVNKIAPQIISQPISYKTSALITAMLTSVIDKGQGKKAGVKGYYLAGKTGTAQLAVAGGYGDETIHSFVGYGPEDDPRFVILVRLDKPKTTDTSSSTATTVFAKIAKFILDYYKIPPQR